MPGVDDPYIPRIANVGGGDGSVSAISGAFNAFNNGLRDLQVSRTLSSANEQLQQMQVQDASESEQRQARNALSMQVGQQLVGLQAPYHQIQTAMQSFMQPKPSYTNPAEILSLADNDPVKQNYISGLNQIKPPKEVDETTQALKESRLEKIQTDQSDKVTAKMDKLRTAVNEFEASNRNLKGRLGTTLARLQEVKGGLLSDPNGTLNKISQGETSQALSSIFGAGVGTEGSRKDLVPNTLNKQAADIETLLTSKLTPYNTPTITKAYSDIVDRLQNIVPAQLNEGKKQTLRAALGEFKSDPDKFSALSESLIKNPDGTPEKAYLKEGRVRFTSDDKIDRLRDAAKWVMSNSKDENAQQVFDTLKENPYYMQAFQDQTFQKLVLGAANSLKSGKGK